MPGRRSQWTLRAWGGFALLARAIARRRAALGAQFVSERVLHLDVRSRRGEVRESLSEMRRAALALDQHRREADPRVAGDAYPERVDRFVVGDLRGREARTFLTRVRDRETSPSPRSRLPLLTEHGPP